MLLLFSGTMAAGATSSALACGYSICKEEHSEPGYCASEGGDGCTPWPTSLRPVSSDCDNYGKKPTGGVCGFRVCGSGVCPCGPILGGQACNGEKDCPPFGPNAGTCAQRSQSPLPLGANQTGEASARAVILAQPTAAAPVVPGPAAANEPVEAAGRGMSGLAPPVLPRAGGDERSAQLTTDYFAALASVHMEADVRIAKGGVSGTGTFQFWADGDKYRINCSTPSKRLGLMSDLQIAFDGGRFQFYHADAEVLSLLDGDRPTVPTAVPNPFFLPADYLSRDSDSCPGCQLKLRDFRERRPTRAAERVRGGVRLTARVTEDTIEWISDDAVVFTVIHFDYPVGANFPHRILVRDQDGAGAVLMEVEYSIRLLETNHPIDPALFTIPRETALYVAGEDGVLQRP